MNGLKNFLGFINENWTSIIIIISLVIAIIQKVRTYFAKTDEQKIEIAKEQLSQIILKLITDAEVDYQNWEKAGGIKRAQVIQKVIAEYPILSKAADQQAIVDYIDNAINEALKDLRKIISENNKTDGNDTVTSGYIAINDSTAAVPSTTTTTNSEGAEYTIKMQ